MHLRLFPRDQFYRRRRCFHIRRGIDRRIRLQGRRRHILVRHHQATHLPSRWAIAWIIQSGWSPARLAKVLESMDTRAFRNCFDPVSPK